MTYPSSTTAALPDYLDRVTAASRQMVADGQSPTRVLNQLCNELQGLAAQIRSIATDHDSDGM